MITLKEILTFQVENEISDLHLITGELPCMRQKQGRIEPLNNKPLTKNDIEGLLNEMLTKEEMKEIEANEGYDFAKDFFDLGRFRINIYYEVR